MAVPGFIRLLDGLPQTHTTSMEASFVQFVRVPIRLRWYLVAMVLATGLPLVVLAIGLITWSTGTLREATEARMLETVRALAYAIDQDTRVTISGLQAITATASPAVGDIQAVAGSIQRVHPGWASVTLVDHSGRQVFHLANPQATLPPGLPADTAQRAFTTGKPATSGIIHGALPGQYLTAFHVPVRGPDGMVVSSLAAAIPAGYWNQFLARQRVPEGWVAGIIDANGLVVARSRNAETFVGKPAPRWVVDGIRRVEEGRIEGPALEGERLSLVFSRSNLTDWTIAFAAPTRVFEKPLRDSMVAASAAGLSMIALASLLAQLFSRRIAKPVEAVSGAARTMAETYELPPMPRTHIREMQTLHNSLQTAAERIGEAARAREALMAARTAFFANISHELRTPLALILGPVDELLAEPGLPAEWRRGLEVVRRNAQTLLGYVSDLLELSRLEADRVQIFYSTTDLARMVRFIADHFVSAAAQRGIDVRVTAPDRLAAEIDAAKVSRIVFNLLSNAFKHVPDTGGRVAVTVATEGGRAVVEVADNGPGIPPEMREKIFERFVQGDDSRRSAGTGLGLAIAKDFAVRHGGCLSLGDAPGGGALFRVELPLAAPAGAQVARSEDEVAELMPVAMPARDQGDPPHIQEQPSESLPQVLVVEDNGDLRSFIARALGGVARVATAGDGVEGLAAAERLRPDLIVTDIMMPRMSGDLMVAELRRRAHLADLSVMVLSARADEPLRIRLLRGQAQDYLVKPFAADELRARVANLLHVKRARDVLRQELVSSEENLEKLSSDVVALNRRLKLAADEMRVALEKAEEASEAKAAFINMVSHELRTPLTQLEVQLALLKRRLRDGLPDQDDALAALTAGLRRLSHLVESVVEYSRFQSGRLTLQPQSFDVAGLMTEACADFQSEAERRGVQLTCTVEGQIPPLVSDPALVGMAVRNLLDNAVKFTPHGRVSARISAGEGHLRIEVADTGPGIPPELQQTVFEPFAHLEDIERKHVPGVGLGLTLVREVAAALGGRVSLSSSPGQGSTFALVLPSIERKV